MEKNREFAFSDKEFSIIRNLVKEHTGINLSDAKRELVYGRIARRLRALKLNNFGQYCALLRDGNAEEFEQFTNAITTNLTSFFREPHHFEHLASRALPEIMEKNRASRRLRIWSAGCSTGEEVYSIAITLRETIPQIEQWNVRILATDLDSNVLAKAQSGIYDRERITGLPKQRLRRWFLAGRGDNEGKVKVAPELQSLIQFKQLNLMQNWPMRGPFDVIFCRNVVIYFDKETQRVLFDRFAQMLDNENHLFVGHSENLLKVSNRFHLLGQTIYRKVA